MKTFHIRILIFSFLMILIKGIFAQRPPDWVKKHPLSSEYYTGIGTAKITKDKTHLAEAKKRALSELASEISVTIENKLFRSITGFNERIENEIINEIRSYTKLELEGYELVDTWEGDGYYWIYYRLSIEKYQSIRQKKIIDAADKAINFLNSAIESAGAGKIEKALRYSIFAANSLSGYINEPIKAGNGVNRYIIDEIYEFLSDLLLRIEIIPAEMNIKTTLDELKDERLLFKGEIRDSGNSDPDFSGLPVRFKLTGGRGEIVSAGVFSNKKTAECRIKYLYPEFKKVSLLAEIDLKAYSVETGISRILDNILWKLSVPSAVINVEVVPLSIFINSNEKIMGKKLQIPLIKGKIENLLLKNGFSIAHDMKNSDLLLNINSDTSKGANSRGFYSVFLNCEILVLKADSKDIILKTLYTNLKGTHNSYRSASEKAYSESIGNISSDITLQLIDVLQE